MGRDHPTADAGDAAHRRGLGQCADHQHPHGGDMGGRRDVGAGRTGQLWAAVRDGDGLMGFNFVDSPTNGQTVTNGSASYTWNATTKAWQPSASGGGGGGS